MLDQLTELPALLADLDAERVLGGLDRRQRVADGADTADATGDARHLGIVPAAHHGLEEARGLGHPPLALLDFAVRHIDDDVAVTLDASQMLDVDAGGRGHGVASNELAVNISAFSAARFCENPARSTSTFSRARMLG